jgi:hypothetical protein
MAASWLCVDHVGVCAWLPEVDWLVTGDGEKLHSSEAAVADGKGKSVKTSSMYTWWKYKSKIL